MGFRFFTGLLAGLTLLVAGWAGEAVAQSASQTLLTSSPNPSTYGQSVDLKAEVEGAGAPAGSVTFFDGATSLGNASLVGGHTGLALGLNHSCALTTAGGVRCWGLDASGQLGDDATLANKPTPVDVAGLSTGVAAIAAGGAGSAHTCALTTAGGVKCWGSDTAGQLGDDETLANKPTPVDVSGLSSGVIAIAAGETHSCALTSDGGAKCWGADGAGQLGDDDTLASKGTPVDVAGLSSGVVAIAAGASHTCALTSAGGVKCWGDDTVGQLGDDATLASKPAPVDVAGLSSGVVAIAAGFQHTCALTSGGGVKCWGQGNNGQLGDGAGDRRPTPVDVSGLTSGVAAIAAGRVHTCALTTGGGAKCWGSNLFGQLGNGVATRSSTRTPQDVVGLSSGVIAIRAGGFHSCAVTGAGGVKCWGSDSDGQLGDDPTIGVVKLTPVEVLARASATLATTAISVGTRSLTAVFTPTSDHTGSTSPAVSQVVERASSTTSIVSSSLNPSTFGQSVTLTATVSGAGTPTGTVEFFDGLVSLGTATLSGGSASLSLAGLSAGPHSIFASYDGGANYLPSVSILALSQTVNRATPIFQAYTIINPSTAGQAVTAEASVWGPVGVAAPTGTVDFYADSLPVGSGTVSGGYAFVNISGLPIGPTTIEARYNGDANYEPASNAFNHSVQGVPAVGVGSSRNPSVFGQPVTLTATVNGGGRAPTGSVAFYFDTTFIGSGTLSGGTASVTTSSLPLGEDTLIEAVYSGDAYYEMMNAITFHSVGQAAATVSLAAAATQRKPGETATLNATVAPVAPSTATPTGTVSFRQGDTEIGSAPVNGAGVATFTTAALPLGAYKYSAVYSGSASFAGATSSVVEVKADYRLGSEAKVNVNRSGPQTRPAVARGANGEALAVWESATAIGQPISIRARRITAAGALAPGEIVVAAATTGAGAPKVAGVTNGDYVVVWHADGASGREIRMRLYAPDGTQRSNLIQVNTVTAGEQTLPVVAGLVGGGFVVAWQTAGEDGSGDGIVAQLFANSGARIGGPFAVNTTTTGDQSSPVVTALTRGGFVIGWTGPTPGGFSGFVQQFTAAGVRVGGETPVSPTAMTATPLLALGMRASNAFQAAWSEPTATLPTDIFAASGGTAAGAVFRVNRATAGAQESPAVTMIEGGKFVISWTTPDREFEGVAAHVFSATSGRIEREFPVNTNESGSQRNSALAPLGAGVDAGKTYVALWSWLARDGDEDIVFQRFAAP